MKIFIITTIAFSSLFFSCDDESSGTPTGTEIGTVMCDKLLYCDPETTVDEYNNCIEEAQVRFDINPPECRDAGWDLAMCIDSSSCDDLMKQGTCGEYYLPLATYCTEEVCGESDFECNDSECISNEFFCDGECDCSECEDEATCDAAKQVYRLLSNTIVA